MEIYDFNITAANNNGVPPNGFPENMEYDEVNDAARELMASVARFFAASLSGTNLTAGTQPAYTLTSGQDIADYAAGQLYAFVAHATSTGSVTLNVDSNGAGNVLDSKGNQLGSGDIVQNGIYFAVRTASAFRVIGALSATSLQAIAANTLKSSFLAGGTADALTITTGLFTAYANGQIISFRAASNNTGAATINIDGLGAEALEDYRSAALAAADIVADRAYIAVRTTNEWRIICGLPIDLANDVVGLLSLTTQVTGALPLANGGTGQTGAAAAFGALKQTATDSATGVVELATDAEVRSSAAGVAGTVVSASQIESASAAVTINNVSSTIALDWDSGINFEMSMDGDYTLSNPTNGQPGTWRTIQLTQDGTGTQTLAYGTQYKFAGGTAPVLSTAANAIDRISIYCRTASIFEVYLNGKDIK